MNYFTVPLLGGLKEGELAILLSGGTRKTYAKNTVIISEGDHSFSFYVINSGKVRVFLSDDQGKEIVLSILGPGAYFGEMALLDDETRSAGVMSMEDTQLTVFSRDDFRNCLVKHPDIATRIMLGLVARLREANKKIGSLALMDVYGRVANTLIHMAKEYDGKLIVDEKLTHQEIANIVGASREMVTRILRELVIDGYITIDKGKRIILNEKP